MKKNDKLTFSHLVDRIAGEAKVSKNAARSLLKEMSSIIDDRLRQDGKVRISRIGIFKLKWQAAKTGRNPQTGELIEISAQNRVVFKPAADLRRFINRNYESEPPEYIDNIKSIPAFHSVKPDSPSKLSTIKWVGLIIVLILLILPGIIYLSKSSFKSPAVVEKKIHHQALKDSDQPVEELLLSEKTEHPPSRSRVSSIASSGVSSGISSDQADKPGYAQSVIKGNTLWMISKAFYADPYLWPNIFRVNLSVINDPDVLEVGTIIHAPPLEGTAENLTSNDIMDIADGYFQVYLAYNRLGKKNAPLFLRAARQFNVQQVSARYENKIGKDKLDSGQ
ncbi:MAG: LysM peptidoglycan-binding domain-containing protein [Deltaproteobacteria bacterium]|nr:LysM peptidoglycan-binding domain-containing protein [Deltaproteobacteria bacterium]